MENAGWMLLVLLGSHMFVASSQNIEGWRNIDCGSDNLRDGNDLITWETDDDYTQTGANKRVPENQPLEEMNTLRFFPDNTQQNCYIVPVYGQTLRYLIRAGFYYGNYDGLSKPPSFDLHIDGKKWATVNTTSSNGGGGPVYHEAMYVTYGSGFLKLCLVQTQKEEVPFISSIEAVPLWDYLYPWMGNNATFHLVTRTNFGGDEIRLTGYPSDELYNRIWTRGTTPSNCVNVETSFDFDALENNPPFAVLSDSIQPKNASDPIILTVDLPQLTPQPAYFVFYLSEFESPDSSGSPNDTRIMQININGQYEQTVVAPDYDHCKVVTIYPVMVVGPTINITLAPTNGSTLPPLIAGMEVFTKQDHDGQSSSGTREHFYFACMFVHVISLFLLLLA